MVKKSLECDLLLEHVSSPFPSDIPLYDFTHCDGGKQKTFSVFFPKFMLVTCGLIVFQIWVLGIYCVDALISVEFFLQEGNQFCTKLFPYGLCSVF